MLRAEDTALVLLAAGRSRRFGETDKLAERFLDQPLAYHVVTALEAVPFQTRIAVVSQTALDFAARGYTVIENAAPEEGQAGSLRLGVAAAQARGASAVLVALADMPRVTATQIYRLFDLAEGPDAVMASSNGVHPTPPALFGANRLPELLRCAGDSGARALVQAGRHVVTQADELIDIDTPEDLAALRARYGLPSGAAAIRAAARRSG
ncbi:nucleotidyltransferase family protein [Sphingomonas sp. PL-96]|uniref:nucleotidyltransferase family protein n=1 Tax=Sphingomonas sp. PL-96 TaxID=2887201 RepID=UPI001E4198D1|nr:nucleotidyltransferase family protein [Sphingomonas sp. PL-96]MCC2977466.1 nucleotidyltransferase family protein [Sphingomonas sp. PL-96]